MKSLNDSLYIFLLLYVDDMLIAAKSLSEVNKLKILLSREFNMNDLGVARKILRMEIRREKAIERLWLSQSGYVRKVLERFIMENAKLVVHLWRTISNCLLHSAQRQMMMYMTCQRSHMQVL